MTDWITWFRYQLRASADGFAWALSQIPLAHHTQLPPRPDYLGTWPPIRHVWHVMEYERCQVIPSMQQWLGGSMPVEETWADDDTAWANALKVPPSDFGAEFQRIRQEQVVLLDQLGQVDWSVPRVTLWGNKPLSMIVTKTFQHTYEHGDTLLRMGLRWDELLAKRGG